MSFFIVELEISAFKILRVLRILRPLRFIEKYEGLRVSLDALINSLISIINILLISFFYFIIFGTLGINLFKGLFQYCELKEIKNLPGFSEDYLTDKWDCINFGGDYLMRDSTFDHIGHALSALFHIS